MDESELVEQLGYLPCTAKSKQSQQRCRRRPVPGLAVCVMHGGKSPAAQERAAENLVDQKADRLVKAIWQTEGVVPVTNPVVSLQRLAGQLQHALDALGEGLNFSKLETRPVQAMAWLRVVRESRQLLSDMERLGIAGKLVELEADKVRLMAVAVGRMFDVLELDEEQRALATSVLMKELRVQDDPEGFEVVPGTVTP